MAPLLQMVVGFSEVPSEYGTKSKEQYYFQADLMIMIMHIYSKD